MGDISNLYYNDDDALIRSPGLEAITVKAKPSPSPPPNISQQVYLSPPRVNNVSSPSSRRQRKSNRRKALPTQGDWVLMREMAPNLPDIAQKASEHALDSASDEDDNNMMDDDISDARTASTQPTSTEPGNIQPEPMDFQQTAQSALITANGAQTIKLPHRDSVVEVDEPHSAVTASADAPTNQQDHDVKHSRSVANGTTGLSPTDAATSSNHDSHSAMTNGITSQSPRLSQLTISSRGPIIDTLPALQTQQRQRDGSISSTGTTQQLPSFRHMDDIARSATSDHEANRSNGYHRGSISSVGQSPTAIPRQLSISSHSISSHSPATPFPPLSASSPISARSDLDNRGDMFLRTGGGSVFGADARRPSQASDGGPFGSSLHGASPSDSYQSSDGLSPGAAPTPVETRPRHMSLDGALASRLLPPPVGSGLPPMSSHTSGTFKCEYQGCTAAPFQTQYLLNSHANVHSQSRPHYCPVVGCPRAEGGKGFKRKNEMIRHGLVHQSPGYVCPFCPDREHKYPRPDNLQRHVRVHHVDKDKDDVALREVLAQRPEGGTRGRRRRVSEAG